MIVLDRLLLGGLSFVFDKVAQAVDAELDDPERLREELLAAQMRYELGEIGDEELAAIESDVMVRLRDLAGGEEARGPLSFSGGDGIGVDVSFGGDEPGGEDER